MGGDLTQDQRRTASVLSASCFGDPRHQNDGIIPAQRGRRDQKGRIRSCRGLHQCPEDGSDGPASYCSSAPVAHHLRRQLPNSRRVRPGSGSTVTGNPPRASISRSITVNGTYFGSVANGSAIYRDVPPGHYHVAPASFVPNSNQDANVEVAAGQQAYLKIVSFTAWGSDNTAAKNIERDAFWVWVIKPTVAEAEIAKGRSGI